MPEGNLIMRVFLVQDGISLPFIDPALRNHSLRDMEFVGSQVDISNVFHNLGASAIGALARVFRFDRRANGAFGIG
jgi:hypothetical protein